MKERGYKRDRYRHREYQNQHKHYLRGFALAFSAQNSRQNDCRRRKQGFAQIHFVAKNLIQIYALREADRLFP